MKNYIILGILSCIINCCNAQICIQKNINTIKLFPPYSYCDVQNLVRIITNGSEVFMLLPVKEKTNGNGYLLKSSRSFENYWDTNEVDKALAKIPYEIDSIEFELYDFGIIWDTNLERFKQKSICDLLSLYFDKEGNAKSFGTLSPMPFVIAELVLRDVKIFINNDGYFIVNNERYCP